MLIEEVRVKNFRSILDETLPCDSLTALVGRNGAGKSAFLSALELFYAASPIVTPGDFYAENTDQDIEIEVTFGYLSAEAKELFSPYIRQDKLSVVRVFCDPERGRSGTLHSARMQNPDFDIVRNAGGRAAVNTAYRKLRETVEYSSLPSARSADVAEEALANWELQNPEKCLLQRDDGQFFGYGQVGGGRLRKFTDYLLIPAVRDAREDATEGRGSPITQMMDLVVRKVLTNRQELNEFKERTKVQYSEIAAPDKLTELTGLQDDLSQTLRSYVPDARVVLDWSELSEISFPEPQAIVRLVEDGYQSTVDRTGHGLQRAFIVTMLQHLASTADRGGSTETDEESESDGGSNSNPNLILAIEEPELYQHPSRQRHIANVLLSLVEGGIPGVAKSTQVIYTTHSPLMVGLDRFDQIRVLRKDVHWAERPKVTKLKRVDIEAVASALWKADGETGEKYTAMTLRPRLQTIMTPWMNEGFFADIVVLVEGEDDRTVILGMARSMNLDFDGNGISVIPCSGKDNIARPYAIFRQLDIPVFVVWDGDFGDKSANPNGNISLLRILGQPEEDWPSFIRDDCACFKRNLEKTLQEEIGHSLFDQLLSQAQDTLGIRKKKQAIKNVSVIQSIMAGAAADGRSSPTIESVVKKIMTSWAGQDVGNGTLPHTGDD